MGMQVTKVADEHSCSPPWAWVDQDSRRNGPQMDWPDVVVPRPHFWVSTPFLLVLIGSFFQRHLQFLMGLYYMITYLFLDIYIFTSIEWEILNSQFIQTWYDTHTHIITYIYIFINYVLLAYIHTYIYIYIHIHVYTHTCIYTYMYIHIHVYTHTCIYTYMYIHIQTSSAKAPIAWQSRWKTWSPRWAKSKIWGKRWDKTSGKSEVKRCEKDVKLLLEPFFWNCFFGTILWNCFFFAWEYRESCEGWEGSDGLIVVDFLPQMFFESCCRTSFSYFFAG